MMQSGPYTEENAPLPPTPRPPPRGRLGYGLAAIHNMPHVAPNHPEGLRQSFHFSSTRT